MKHLYTLSFCLAATLLSVRAQTVVIDSAALEANAVNDVYYSIPSHSKHSVAANWDIALSTQPSNPPSQTVLATTVRINGGRGVKLFKITNATIANFNTAFTNADSVNWKQLHDSPTNWDFGGVYSTHNVADPFDYGWGNYQQSSHDVVGDSVYAVRTLNGGWKKIAFTKLAYDTAWYITTADLDNNNMQSLVINKDQGNGKNFVYVTLENGNAMDNEPAAWDMLFTRYEDLVQAGPSTISYSVNGVLLNKGVTAVKAYPVDDTNSFYANFSSGMSSNINTIGFDWKTYDLTNMTYNVEDSLVYFIKAQDNNVYKLRFTDFRAANVESVFEISDVNTSMEVIKNTSDVLLYPNPATDRITIVDFNGNSHDRFRIADATGKIIREGSLTSASLTLNVSNISNGLYVLQIIKDRTVQTKSFVVNR